MMAESEKEAERGSVDRSQPAFKIAAKFGGVVAFAAALGKAPSTVHRWLVSGLIPAKHQRLVLDKARERRIALKPADFIPESSLAA